MNAAIGDRWRMPLVDTACADSLFYITVIDTGSTYIKTFNLKFLYVKIGPILRNDGSTYYINDSIIERFGFRYDAIDYSPCYHALSETFNDGLRCYSDDVFGYYNPKKKNCDYMYVTSVSNVSKNLQDMMLFPNPANDYLYLTNLKQKNRVEFEVFDYSGRFIFRNSFSTIDNEKISIPFLQNGIYIYSVYSDGKYVSSGKFNIIH